jgi:hypothetical protein
MFPVGKTKIGHVPDGEGFRTQHLVHPGKLQRKAHHGGPHGQFRIRAENDICLSDRRFSTYGGGKRC